MEDYLQSSLVHPPQKSQSPKTSKIPHKNQADDPDLPAYYYDPIINPLPAWKGESSNTANKTQDQEDENRFLSELLDPEDGFELPQKVAPLLENVPLFTDDTAAGINLYWAPHPFNQKAGKTRRAQDVPLVMSW